MQEYYAVQTVVINNFFYMKMYFLGMLGTNGSFLKSQKSSQPLAETDEGARVEMMQLQKNDGVSVSLSRDSLETNGKK